MDDKNRSQGALQYNSKYGKYDALFIGPDSNNIYMTFDEGYEYGLTPAFLDILKDKGVKALFFVTYDFVNRNGELVQRMIDEGHTIGNHSWSHKNYSTLSPKAAAEDMMKLHNLVKEKFNYEMKYFRFPSGNFNEQCLAVVQGMGYKSLFWSFAYKDWLVDDQPNPATSLKKIVDSAHPGAIYLLHAVSKTNADILAEAIDQIREAGFAWADPSTI
ncbi:MAG: polysaccharide deacetylase family protein [Angelakisella sp.]|nr:polysaccharide deacetylase family protein [Angelakisella sp.]